MNCTCVKDLEGKLPKFANAGEGATATCEATAIGITEDMGIVMHLTLPFRISGSVKPYNKAKGHVVPFAASYCPFCGRAAKPGAYTLGQDAAIAATLDGQAGDAREGGGK